MCIRVSLQVGRAEGAGRLLQAQGIEDVVVAAVVVVAHGGVQLALGVEHVDDVAGADLVADLGGFQRTLVGDDRLAPRLDLLDVGIHRAVQVAGVLHHLAALAFAGLLALVEALVGLADLGGGQAAAVDRDVQFQANAALVDILAIVHQRIGGAVGEAEGVVVALLVLGHGIEGRQVPGLALAEGFLGGVDRVVAGQQAQVLLHRGVDPGLGVVRRRRHHRQGVAHALDGAVVAVGQGHQGLEGIVHALFGDQPVGAGGVVAGLGLEHVGLIGKAHVEALVCLVQLALEGGFLGLAGGQVVLGAEHREVGLGAAQDQVLLGRGEFQPGLVAGFLGGLPLEPAVGAEQWLAEGGLDDLAVALDGRRTLVEGDPGVSDAGAGAELRQQAGAGLGHHFLARQVVGLGGGEVGVVVDGFLVDADQVGLGRQRGRLGGPGDTGSSGHGGRQGESAQHSFVLEKMRGGARLRSLPVAVKAPARQLIEEPVRTDVPANVRGSASSLARGRRTGP